MICPHCSRDLGRDALTIAEHLRDTGDTDTRPANACPELYRLRQRSTVPTEVPAA